MPDQNAKIAVIQLHPEPLQPQINFDKAVAFIRSAASQGAELVVLPEYHLTGWKPEDPRFLSVCESCEDWVNKYQGLAKELGICIIPGTILSQDKTSKDNKLLNICYFISPTGTITGEYIKKNLWGPERKHLTSSSHAAHQVFDTPLGKVGLLICWDLAFPEAFRELVAKGARIIVVPTFWTLMDCTEKGRKLNPRAEALFLESVVVARAFEGACAVVFANAAGPAEEGYAGLSQVAVPFIGPLAKLEGCEEDMLVVDLDLSVLEEADRCYGIREDLASEDWHYEYRHTRTEDEGA